MTLLHRQTRNSCILYWILVFVPGIFSYNLDSKYPILYRKDPVNNYFGFSVGLLRNRNVFRALITAPRANSTSNNLLVKKLHQPGVLFSCDIPFSGGTPSCEEITVDKKGNSYSYNSNDNFSYKDKKDDMWLGVSLDVQQGPKENNVVVCGHLWKNQYYREHYLANGACYVINSDLDTNKVEKLVPFVNKAKQSLTPPGIYYYAFGQAGTSATFSDDGQYLLLGGPGYYDWIGTILSYKLDPNGEIRNLRRPVIPDPPFDQKPSSDGYIGYSVTSGKFLGGDVTYSAVGAPRDGNNHGRVYIFQPLDDESRKLVVYQKKEGVQFGEYFGASVCGTDLNNDGLTDLLVGAPFHSIESGGDEGKVYVYISNKQGLQFFDGLLGQKKPNSRFGTCIGNVGDLNQDGFNDVAIGATYEDEKGAVYIYHGSSKGLNVQYVQRIGAKDINPMISGFGISVSRGLDVDNNFYPDILIGSYSSSNAVLLRTHPVIHLSSKIEFDPPQIHRNVTDCEYNGEKVPCFNVTYCVQYSGRHAPRSLEFTTELKMDSSRQSITQNRGGLLFHDGELQSSISRTVNLSVGLDSCLRETAYIYSNTKDVITPVQFFLSYDYAGLRNSRDFCSNCPVIDASSPTNNTKAIPFQTECGADNTCRTDVVVKAHVAGNLNGKTLIIGQNSTLTLDITISNRGEPAYLAELYIRLPPEVPLVKHSPCNIISDQQKQQVNATLQCDLGNPLNKDKAVNIQIKIDVKNIPVSTKTLYVFFEAFTVSEEINDADNKLYLPITFKALSDISITGNPEDEQIPYSVEKKMVSIAHKYYVMNHGPSPVDVIEINLLMPNAVQTEDGLVDFLNFTGIMADSGELSNIPATCNGSLIQLKQKDSDEDINVNRPKGNVFNESDLVQSLEPNGSDSNLAPRRKRSVGESTAASIRRREANAVDCYTAKCVMIRCFAGPFPDDQKIARIVVVAQVNLEVLSNALEPWNRIQFITTGKVFMRGANVQPQKHRPDEITVKTEILRSGLPPPEKISNWIIFVSIGIGILLLLIILIVLIKATCCIKMQKGEGITCNRRKIGFFKRRQKEKMKKMMVQAHLKEWDPNLIPNEETTETDNGSDSDVNKNHT